MGTPVIRPRKVPCYLCMKCPPVCPSGALKRTLTKKEEVRMGTAVIDTKTCLAWQGTLCRSCFDDCPIFDEAIKMDDKLQPVVVKDKCIGCGVCENVCPADPDGDRRAAGRQGMTRKIARKTVQLSSIGLLFLVPFLNRKGITAITGTLYSFAVGPVWLTDPVIGVQTILTTMRLDATLLLSLLIPVGLALVLGRVFCSWVCPQNTLSELFDALANRTGIRRLFTLPFTPIVRYTVLVLVLLASLVLRFPVVSLLPRPGSSRSRRQTSCMKQLSAWNSA